jgi:hypothetical protein
MWEYNIRALQASFFYTEQFRMKEEVGELTQKCSQGERTDLRK